MLSRESNHPATHDLDFAENMEQFHHSFAHNTMIEDLDKQLPVLAYKNTSQDDAVEAITADLAALEISTPATTHGTWLEK